MKITEHNYEEYFLLYTDNELSASERTAVEAFVRENPAYEALLQTFAQTRLEEDDFSFENKNLLYKNADEEIGITNYEEYFLLYTDDELSEKDKANTERFVLQHPELQPQFTMLQQTKLPVETVAHPNKKELYRKEKTRVVPLFFYRSASVAAVLLLVFLSWLLYPTQHRSNTARMASTNIPKQPADPLQSQSAPSSVQPLNSHPDEKPQVTETQQAETNESKQSAGKKMNEPEPAQYASSQSKTEKEKNGIETISSTLSQKESLIPEVQITAIVKEEIKKPVEEKPFVVSALKPLERVDEDEDMKADLRLASALSSGEQETAKPAVYHEVNTEENQTLYVGALQLNKAKVNGILKSASHLFGGKNKQTEDR